MTVDEAREKLNAQISALVGARDNMSDEAEKKATSAAIKQLRADVNDLDLAMANSLGDKVGKIIAKLDSILEQNDLSATSALGRSIARLREDLDQ